MLALTEKIFESGPLKADYPLSIGMMQVGAAATPPGGERRTDAAKMYFLLLLLDAKINFVFWLILVVRLLAITRSTTTSTYIRTN